MANRNYEVIDDGDEEPVHVYSDEVLTVAECDEVYQRVASAPPSPASEAARVVRAKLRMWMQKRREARGAGLRTRAGTGNQTGRAIRE